VPSSHSLACPFDGYFILYFDYSSLSLFFWGLITLLLTLTLYKPFFNFFFWSRIVRSPLTELSLSQTGSSEQIHHQEDVLNMECLLNVSGSALFLAYIPFCSPLIVS
jgi:hypothetical protein